MPRRTNPQKRDLKRIEARRKRKLQAVKDRKKNA
jgi:hypothetical protein